MFLHNYLDYAEQAIATQDTADAVLTPLPTSTRSEFVTQLIACRWQSPAIHDQCSKVMRMNESEWRTYRTFLLYQVCNPDDIT